MHPYNHTLKDMLILSDRLPSLLCATPVPRQNCNALGNAHLRRVNSRKNNPLLNVARKAVSVLRVSSLHGRTRRHRQLVTSKLVTLVRADRRLLQAMVRVSRTGCRR